MKKHYSWDELREKARADGLYGDSPSSPMTVASEVDQTVSIGEDHVYIAMEHTEQRSVSISREEIEKFLKEMKSVKENHDKYREQVEAYKQKQKP